MAKKFFAGRCPAPHWGCAPDPPRSSIPGRPYLVVTHPGYALHVLKGFAQALCAMRMRKHVVHECEVQKVVFAAVGPRTKPKYQPKGYQRVAASLLTVRLFRSCRPRCCFGAPPRSWPAFLVDLSVYYVVAIYRSLYARWRLQAACPTYTRPTQRERGAGRRAHFFLASKQTDREGGRGDIICVRHSETQAQRSHQSGRAHLHIGHKVV